MLQDVLVCGAILETCCYALGIGRLAVVIVVVVIVVVAVVLVVVVTFVVKCEVYLPSPTTDNLDIIVKHSIGYRVTAQALT